MSKLKNNLCENNIAIGTRALHEEPQHIGVLMRKQDIDHGLPQSMGTLVEGVEGGGVILGRSLKAFAERRIILERIHAVCHRVLIGRLKGHDSPSL